MTDVSGRNFGFLIAYVIPGFVVVAAASTRFPIIQSWFAGSGENPPTVGGFMYVTVAAVLAGMTVSAVRWVVLDRIHNSTGIHRPAWDFSRLQAGRESFEYLAEMHFRYYEFFGHMLIATLLALFNADDLARQLGLSLIPVLLMLIGVAALFFFASRDALCKFYDRTDALLAKRDSEL